MNIIKIIKRIGIKKMIDGIKLNTEGISPYQRRLRLKELSGVPLTEDEKKRLKPRTTLLSETVSMVEIPKNRKQNVLPKIEVKPDEVDDYDDLDLDEILREMGYGDDESLEEIKFDSKGYTEGRKLVDKLRRGLFRKLNDDELEDFKDVLRTSFDLN